MAARKATVKVTAIGSHKARKESPFRQSISSLRERKRNPSLTEVNKSLYNTYLA